MKRIYIALFAFCALLLAVPAQAQSSQQRPPKPELLGLIPIDETGGEATQEYMYRTFWGLRYIPFAQTKAYAAQMTAWMKWADQVSDEMENGTRPQDKALYDELVRGAKNWMSFYLMLCTHFDPFYTDIDLKKNSQGQWAYKTQFPRFSTGVFTTEYPASEFIDGKSMKGKNCLVSYKDGKRPFRFGHFIEFPDAPPKFQPDIISDEEIEIAKKECNLALNVALLFEGYPVETFQPIRSAPSIDFDVTYHKALMYYTAVTEAIANNTPDKMEFEPMPKAGGMHASMKAKVLAIEKGISKDVVDVVITSDFWQIERNAAGQPIRRVIFGYSIVNTANGKMANRVSWAEEHQGGGKYGDLHAYGNGTESFYVK